MGLLFGGATSDRVNVSPCTNIDNVDPQTWLIRLRIDTLTGGRAILSKASTNVATGRRLRISGTGGDIQMQVARDGINANYITNDTPMVSTGTWRNIGIVSNAGAAAGEIVNIYTSAHGAALVESTYGTATDGDNSFTNDAADDVIIGNDVGNAIAMQGIIAEVAIFGGALTLNQMNAWCWRPRASIGTTKALMFHILGYNGTGTQPDLSGNGNAGTITGATLAQGAPSPRPFRRAGGLIVPGGAAAGGGGVIFSRGGLHGGFNTRLLGGF